MEKDFDPVNQNTVRTRRRVSFAVGLLHLPVAALAVLAILAEALKPIPGPDGWPLALFLVTMFPVNVLACVGAFTNPCTGLALVPVNSVIWGYLAGLLWQRIFRP